MLTLITGGGGQCGNLVPPPSYELCFEPTTAQVFNIEAGFDYRRRVELDEYGCGLVRGDYDDELEASAEGFCTLRSTFEHLRDGQRVSLTPGMCPVPDLGVPEQGVPEDQGALDAAPDADSDDASVEDGSMDGG